MQNKFKAFAKEIIIFGLLLFVLANVLSYLRKPSLDSDILPKISLKLLDQKVFIPKENQALIIHFWATWCPTCKLEASNIQSLSKDYQVLSIAVNSGINEDIQDYMQKNHLNFPVYNDKDGSFAKAFKVQAFPTTFIYNAQGKRAFTEVGYTSQIGFLARLKLLN